MNRRAVLGAAALVLIGAAALWDVVREKPTTVAAAPSASAPAPAEPEPAPAPESTAAPEPAAPSPARASRFDFNDDGSPVAPLPASAPERVRLGVAIFAYSGAQGIPPGHRSAAAALDQARAAIAGSGGDFSKVLAKADTGSREDMGWFRRGILEKRVEQAVFSLDKGATSREPIDTPRGYWVVLRTQ